MLMSGTYVVVMTFWRLLSTGAGHPCCHVAATRRGVLPARSSATRLPQPWPIFRDPKASGPVLQGFKLAGSPSARTVVLYVPPVHSAPSRPDRTRVGLGLVASASPGAIKEVPPGLRDGCPRSVTSLDPIRSQGGDL